MAHLEPRRPAEDLAQPAAAQPQLLLERPATAARKPGPAGRGARPGGPLPARGGLPWRHSSRIVRSVGPGWRTTLRSEKISGNWSGAFECLDAIRLRASLRPLLCAPPRHCARRSATATTRNDLRSDLLAGVVVGIVALPLSMALAVASGVAPQYGLYTAIIAGVVIAALGGSMVQVSGPTAAFVVLIARSPPGSGSAAWWLPP